MHYRFDRVLTLSAALALIFSLLSGCAYNSPRSMGFASQLKKNIYGQVRDSNLADSRPIPPQLLIMIFFYDHGALKDARVVQSSGNPDVDASTEKLVLSADIPRLTSPSAGLRTRYIVNFCFIPDFNVCDDLMQRTNVRKVVEEYDQTHPETRGIADPSDTN